MTEGGEPQFVLLVIALFSNCKRKGRFGRKKSQILNPKSQKKKKKKGNKTNNLVENKYY